VASWDVTATSYATYSVDHALTAGSHRVTVEFNNDYRSATCDRNLYVDEAIIAADTTTATPIATATPTPTPAPSDATVGPTTLRWAPPALTAPTTIDVGTGDTYLKLDVTRDYILKMPQVTKAGRLAFSGGRNVVVKGGSIRLPAGSFHQHAIHVAHNVGTVHLEGLLIDGSSGIDQDAIQINSPDSVFQIQNLRVLGLRGSFGGYHADVVQPYGGVKTLRIDRLSASSNYQGLFLRPDLGPIGSMDIRQVDLSYDMAGAIEGGYLVWLTTGCATAPATFEQVYVYPRSGKSLGQSVWPSTTHATCPAVQSGNQVSWPKLPITGAVTLGPPTAGPFVPQGTVGPAYVTPGYR
jgi:hypothetical protein